VKARVLRKVQYSSSPGAVQNISLDAEKVKNLTCGMML
jgi:hypothetical protein